MRTQLELEKVGKLVEGKLENPFELLGPHEVRDRGRRALAIRAYLPHLDQAWVVDPAHEHRTAMRRIHPAGLFEAVCDAPASGDQDAAARYMIQATDETGKKTVMHDPYAFPNLLTDYDLYLLNEGRHYRSYERLGAHLRTVDGVDGVHFAVWAPNATSVSLIGDFNDWDGRRHPMRKHVPSGFWELFIPGLEEGVAYKYQIHNGDWVSERSDPYGFYAEVPPRTASVVSNINDYEWNDAEWIAKREKSDFLHEPMSVYEVHLGSWRRPGDDWTQWLSYRDLAQQLVEYVVEMGYTHIELLPVAEHPLSASWGYQCIGYFSVTSRYGTPEDFMYLVDLCHQHGIGVIMDWVPAHFPRDGHGLRRFDGTALYEHEDPRQGEHRDWGTHIFNYGRHEVRNYLIANAMFWLDKYHIDGLRVDAVASMLYLDYSKEDGDWIPNEFGGRENLAAIDFLKEFNEQVHLQFPGVLTVAEESTAWPGVSQPTYCGGLGFSMKWNMGWMNDTLSYMRHEPIHRKYHHDGLTFSLIYAFHENFVLPFSHDEVVHGKGSMLNQMPGDLWQKFANLRLLYAYMFAHPGKKLQFMGAEFGQWNEWDFDTSLQWHLLQWDSHKGLQKCVADLNKLYREEASLHELDFDGNGFEWIDCHNWEESTFAFIRKSKDPKDYTITVCNFTPVPRTAYRLGVPEAEVVYKEIFNSDSSFYDGSNVGNGEGLFSERQESHGMQASIELQVPPLGAVILKPQRQ